MKTKLLSLTLIIVCISVYAQTTVTSSVTGRVWADRNLGATQVATSIDDTDAMGSLYQWGRNADGHQDRASASVSNSIGVTAGTEGSDFIFTGFAINDWLSTSDDTRWSNTGVGGAENPCTTLGSGFRVPTSAEWVAEFLTTTFTDADAFASFLKLPHTGYRSTGDGNIYDVATTSYYWTSNPAIQKYFHTDGNNDWGSWKSHGMAVRCIYDATLSTSNVKLLEGFKMYPNPVNVGTEISFEISNTVKNVKVFVYDVTGKEIYKQESEERTIKLVNVSKGLYLIKFVLDNKETVNKELVIK